MLSRFALLHGTDVFASVDAEPGSSTAAVAAQAAREHAAGTLAVTPGLSAAQVRECMTAFVVRLMLPGQPTLR